MSDDRDERGTIQDWTAEKIKVQWLNDKDTARAIQRAELSMRKLDEGEKIAVRFPDPSVFDMGKAKYASPQELLEPFHERAALLTLIQELQESENITPSIMESVNCSEQLGRIIWKGYKSDLGRIYIRLSKGLLECSAAEWERHFIGPKGQDMAGAVENAKKLDHSTSRSAEIVALESAVDIMNPDEPVV